MKDNRLKTSFENYEAFDVISGSNFGGWTDRDHCLAIADFLNGSIETHADYDLTVRAIAESTDADLSDVLSDLTRDIEEIIAENADYLYADWRDNELIILPAIEGATEDHREDGRCGDELPDTANTGATYLVINERGNTSLYQFTDNVTGWRELWAVV